MACYCSKKLSFIILLSSIAITGCHHRSFESEQQPIEVFCSNMQYLAKKNRNNIPQGDHNAKGFDSVDGKKMIVVFFFIH